MDTIDSSKEISVAVVEDHDRVRAAVCDILDAAEGVHVVGEAGDGARAVELVAQAHPDVLVLDIDLETISGEIAVGPLLRQFPETRVLVLTSYDDSEYVRGFVDQGAAGCLLKEDVPAWLVEAVRTVQETGDKWISPRLAE